MARARCTADVFNGRWGSHCRSPIGHAYRLLRHLDCHGYDVDRDFGGCNRGAVYSPADESVRPQQNM